MDKKRKKVYFCICRDCDYKVKKIKDMPCSKTTCLDCGKPLKTILDFEEKN